MNWLFIYACSILCSKYPLLQSVRTFFSCFFAWCTCTWNIFYIFLRTSNKSRCCHLLFFSILSCGWKIPGQSLLFSSSLLLSLFVSNLLYMLFYVIWYHRSSDLISSFLTLKGQTQRTYAYIVYSKQNEFRIIFNSI